MGLSQDWSLGPFCEATETGLGCLARCLGFASSSGFSECTDSVSSASSKRTQGRVPGVTGSVPGEGAAGLDLLRLGARLDEPLWGALAPLGPFAVGPFRGSMQWPDVNRTAPRVIKP